MTICNMTIEASARTDIIAVDDTIIKYLKKSAIFTSKLHWEQAILYWRTLISDPGAKFDNIIKFNATEIKPQVTCGTSPEMVVAIDDKTPDQQKELDPIKRDSIKSISLYETSSKCSYFRYLY